MKFVKIFLLLYVLVIRISVADFAIYDYRNEPKIKLENAILISKNYLKEIVGEDLSRKYYLVSVTIGSKNGSSWYVTFGSKESGRYVFHVDGSNIENWFRLYPNDHNDIDLPKMNNLGMWKSQKNK